MAARTKNKALVYVRRSKSKQETGIRTQLKWAIDAAKEHELQLDATPENLEYMVVRGLSQHKSIFVDDGISGSNLTSVGVHRRFSPDGPRNLDDDNDRREDGEAKFTLNPDSQIIVRPTGYNPEANLELFDKCRQLTEERGRSQRGIPRGVNLDRYPLSTLIHDITDGCGAVLFGHKAEHKLEYECSRYRQSSGRECQRHVVDAEASLRFVLGLLRQRIKMGGGREAIRERVRQIADIEELQRPHILEEELQLAEQRLGRLEAELETLSHNAGLASNVKLLRAIEQQYEQKEAEVEAAREEVKHLRGRAEETGGSVSLDEEIDAAMALFDRIDRLTRQPDARTEIGEMLRELNLRMWLRFQVNPRGKRPKRVLQGGFITIGQGEPPLAYESPRR